MKYKRQNIRIWFITVDTTFLPGPVLDPFNFPENLREGRRTTLTCMVSAGDPPISFRWEKDGEPIQPNVLDATVEYINQYTSTLFFEKASQKHNGNYTCIASNPYASANHTASLTLNSTSGVSNRNDPEDHFGKTL
ncbi:UNVERIFIED_CONTAM: Dscam2 [Trichonephila clavipes]